MSGPGSVDLTDGFNMRERQGAELYAFLILESDRVARYLRVTETEAAEYSTVMRDSALWIAGSSIYLFAGLEFALKINYNHQYEKRRNDLVKLRDMALKHDPLMTHSFTALLSSAIAWMEWAHGMVDHCRAEIISHLKT